MKIKLEKPICFFDIESSGLSISEDKIVSISVLKLHPDGTMEGKSMLINPTIPIKEEATLVHGITNEMVKDHPTFKQISKALHAFFKDCDIAGYNSDSFDIPILYEEFSRCDIEYPTPDVKNIDVFNIFKKKETRDLKAATMFYCNRELEDAHSSDADTIACKDIFLAQLERYDDLTDKTVDEIMKFSKMDNRVDFAGKIIIDNDGDYVYNFGKSKGNKIKNDTGFGEWMLKQTFITKNTKSVVNKILADILMNKS
jgi:DNA polymerase III subunit epsilon